MESAPSPVADPPTATPRAHRSAVGLRVRSLGFGVLAAALLVLLIALGSRGFHWFDEALIGYAVGTIFATAAVVYKYTYWLARPQTQRYWRRGWQLFLSFTSFRRYRGLIPRTIVTDLLTQRFIRRRGLYRWAMHLCLFWGVVLSCAITFPLTFGWLRFTQAPLGQYRIWFFGFPFFSFAPDSLIGVLIIHALDWTALLLLVGLVLALHRFRFDMVPLGLLLAIVVTGLALTADNMWLGGAYYWFISLTHEAVVVLWLISLPFGKFFHLIERPATLGVDLYWQAAQDVEMQACPRCGERFAPAPFLRDLKRTLADVGENYTLPASISQQTAGGDATSEHTATTRWWSDLCPQCKRIMRAQAHLAVLDPSGNRFL
jgi:hypothetical protein